MTRLFLSFYLFIAIAIIGLSTALEPLFYGDDKLLPPQAKDIKAQLAGLSGENKAKVVANLDVHKPKVMPLTSLAFSENSLTKLFEGEVLALFYQDSVQLYALADNESLYEFTFSVPPNVLPARLYSLVFFITLGIAVALWIWPLWRDLSNITKGIRSVNTDGSLPTIIVPKRSVVAPISTALNALSQQVSELLSRHKEMTGAVAHELRTPLARLKFTLGSNDTPDEVSWLAMREDVNELERMVQEMLDYLRYDGKPPELNVSQIPVTELLQNIALRVKPQYSELNIEILPAPLTIMGDGYFIERAIENVVLNAIRYAHTKVILSAEQHKEWVVIHVEDDGPGVAPEDAEKIFTPFFRPDSARTRERGGAGLGLAIVKRIQSWHHGHCKVSRSKLGGADFSISYPTQP